MSVYTAVPLSARRAAAGGSATDDALARTAADLAARPSLWRHAVHFSAEERQHTQILVGADIEAWLLTWLPGQGTEIHDHGGSAGAFTVIRGCLQETLPDASGRTAPTVRELTTGTVGTFGPAHVHAVANRGTVPAVSLHVYGPRLRSMTRYALAGRALEVVGVERAGSDW